MKSPFSLFMGLLLAFSVLISMTMTVIADHDPTGEQLRAKQATTCEPYSIAERASQAFMHFTDSVSNEFSVLVSR